MSIKDRLDNCKSSGFHVSCDVDVVHARSGEIVAEQKLHNIVVNQGLNYLVGMVASTSSTFRTNYIGPNISPSAPLAADVDMLGPAYAALSGMERATGAISIGVGSVGMFSVAKTFTASAVASVGSVGLYTESSGTKLFAGVALTAPPVLQAADTLAITWTVQFS